MSEYIGYNHSDLVQVGNNANGIKMFDKLTRIKSDRRIMPLDKENYIPYEHRGYYNDYCLEIGDSCFMIPPEFIMITSESLSNSLVTLRQENTLKEKHGKHKRTILIDLVFNSLEQINGYKVPGPDKDYYVDGLRQLLAQFKCTPFLPITNTTINHTYGIYTVVLQAINISTVVGFPEMLKAQITLQEVNMMPYLEVPDIFFKNMIDWDLFKFYYQRFLTETNEYKKLQSITKNHDSVKIKILNPEVFQQTSVNEYNILDVVTDKTVLMDGELSNYKTWLSSTEDEFYLTGFQCGYSNLLTNVQMSKLSSPTVQFLGGMDTIYNITLETTNEEVIKKIEQCQLENDAMIRNNPKIQASVGFVKLESELVAFTGSLFVMIESVTTNTVPGFPNLYNIQIQCVSYDIAQSEQEDLNGFWPFDKGNENPYSTEQSKTHDEQVITQSYPGLVTKIKQDNYAEYMLRKMEVYPDLHLPTYEEVDEQILKIRKFREKNKLSQIEYSKYPTRPAEMLHGTNPNKTIDFSYERLSSDTGIKGLDKNSNSNIVDVNTISREEYEGYVDPDFYVFYPYSNQYLEELEPGFFDSKYKPTTLNSYDKKVTAPPEEVIENNLGNTTGDSTLIQKFLSLAKSMIGHSYVWGAYGNKSDSKGLVFDCSGLISWCLKTLGITNQRFTTSTIPTSPVFTKISNSEMMPGDILLKTSSGGSNGHVAIYEGNDQIVHARGAKYGVVEGPISQIKYTSVYRVNGLYTESNNKSYSNSASNGDMEQNAKFIWNFFREKGFTDYAIAGMLGNIQHESGLMSNSLENTKERKLGYNDKTYTNAVDNGTYKNFANDGAGYGIVQFTYSGYKQQLLNRAKANNVSVSNLQLQCEILYEQIQNIKPLLNSAGSVSTATQIFLTQYEKPSNPSASVSIRKANASRWYSKFSSGVTIADSAVPGAGGKQISEDSLKQIACAIDSIAKGCQSNTKKYIAQMVYDRLTDKSKRWNSVSSALSTFNINVTEPDTETYKIVEKVFLDTEKANSNSIIYLLDPNSPVADFERYDNAYDRITTVEQFTFWGSKTNKSSTVAFVKSLADSIKESTTKEVTVSILSCDPDKFAEPLIINTTYYKDNNSKVTEQYRNFINSTYYSYHTAFCSMYQYSCKGRLVKAFPAYLMCILDDNSCWYKGDKLWTNFYTHKSVLDIQYHATNDMPVETATIVLNNIYHNLSRTQGGLSQYELINDDEQFISMFGISPGKWVYKNFGIKLGFGAKLTSMMIELHQILYNHAKLREGSRIHLRCGYGSDPMSLGPIINGFISDVTLGDQVSIVVTSDGNELILNPVSTKENDTNSGWLGLFGLGENQESSNIIADVMCKRRGFANVLSSSWYEQSKYSIEHFGLYFSTSLVNSADDTNRASYVAVSDAFNDTNGNVNTINETGASTGTNIADLWNQWSEQYDLLKNIYRANYKGELYVHDDASILPTDGEQNVVFNKFNMTPWDVCQVCTQQVPEYIFKSSMHQFDSRAYFGLPFWQEKYRYDFVNNNTVLEECRTASQVHYIDSIESIIDNQMTVTSKFTNTNIKVMYTSGKSSTSTSTIHSDDTIDLSKQKTKILDTPISQNILGPDQIIEFLGYKVGYNSARRTGISNLIYGWNQEYQGQIILTGNPGIKPGDYLLINDTYCDIFGVCIVREVTHSFSVNTGFITSVTPGLIAFSSDQNSGMIENCKSLLDLLGVFSAYSRIREEFYEKYESNMSIISTIDVLEEMTKKQARLQEEISTYHATANALSIVRGALTVAQISRTISTLSQAVTNLKTFVTGIKTFKNIFTVASGLVTGTLNLIPGVGWIVSVAINIILNSLIEYLDNKNVIVLLPLWWEGYPMASLIKDGEHILLIPNNSTATDDTMDSEANNIQYED